MRPFCPKTKTLSSFFLSLGIAIAAPLSSRSWSSPPHFVVSSVNPEISALSDETAEHFKDPKPCTDPEVSSGPSGFQPYSYGGGFQPPAFPVVRLRGLPFNCTDIDIIKFFAGLDIVDVLLVNKNGRFTGEAFVVFAGSMQVEFALQRDRQNMGRRYVEVFRCKRQDYYNAIAAEVNYEGIYDTDYHGSPPPSKAKRFSDKDQLEYTDILKMRGLPFSVKKPEIIEFFKEFKLVEERIHIACRPDGKATGEAYVEFVSVEEAKRAMSKDKMTIGSRYVELFPSTPDEARRAESRSRQ
ncbi:heterogeneous nuclear ribonucleoprotein H isoform X1 [Manihot esculenta]|uniref:RRM domain-containing protein n=2 Tax=Manihot esculenta TaxID=3983 RepID=A0A2C9WKZ6_MANES|nr:heterogeneous nuclear ribonucleoprotein H isoform X1 [Manihot esculenta]OAY60992.1 hypothetical protein MANES_01G155200v8 [Manihot esculenta]